MSNAPIKAASGGQIVLIVGATLAFFALAANVGKIIPPGSVTNNKVPAPDFPTAAQRAEMEKQVAPYRNPVNLFNLLVRDQEAK
jgi:hypothetical protein